MQECENHSLTCSRNLLYGFPGETADDYTAPADRPLRRHRPFLLLRGEQVAGSVGRQATPLALALPAVTGLGAQRRASRRGAKLRRPVPAVRRKAQVKRDRSAIDSARAGSYNWAV